MRITISGKAWSAGIEASEISKEIGLPEPDVRRVGKGYQHVYDVTREQADDLVWHFDTLADCWMGGGVDPESHREGYACRKAADAIRKVLANSTADTLTS